MPRRITNHEKALEALTHAQESLGKALTALGGKTRYRPKALPVPPTFVARQYLESVINRVSVVQQLLATPLTQEYSIEKIDVEEKLAKMLKHFPGLDPPYQTHKVSGLRDDFEHAYDSERRPEC